MTGALPARPVRPAPEAGHPAGRATQEIDRGRRGKGYLLGAFQPATRATFTQPCDRRTTANFVAFLERAEA